MPDINNRKDILLLLLYSPGRYDNFNEPITGRTRLIKTLFLFKEELLNDFKKNLEFDEDKFYHFESWDYGPFSKDVFEDIEFFILINFVQTKNSEEEGHIESFSEYDHYKNEYINYENEIDIYQEEEFSLTEKGESFAADLYKKLSSNQKNMIKEFKKRISSMPLRALLRYVYKTYPELTNKSKIKDKMN